MELLWQLDGGKARGHRAVASQVGHNLAASSLKGRKERPDGPAEPRVMRLESGAPRGDLLIGHHEVADVAQRHGIGPLGGHSVVFGCVRHVLVEAAEAVLGLIVEYLLAEDAARPFAHFRVVVLVVGLSD